MPTSRFFVATCSYAVARDKAFVQRTVGVRGDMMRLV